MHGREVVEGRVGSTSVESKPVNAETQDTCDMDVVEPHFCNLITLVTTTSILTTLLILMVRLSCSKNKLDNLAFHSVRVLADELRDEDLYEGFT